MPVIRNFLARMAESAGASRVGSPGGTVKARLDKAVFFDTVADMVAASWLEVGMHVFTGGYSSLNDGGGNHYEVVAAATGTDDGGSYIDLDTYQAEANFQFDFISAKKFGVAADGSTDDTSALQAAYDYAASVGKTLQLPDGNILCSDDVFFGSSVCNVVGHGCGNPDSTTAPSKITFNADKTLYIGRTDVSTMAPLFGVVIRDFAITKTGVSTPTKPALQIAADRSTIDLHVAGGVDAVWIEAGTWSEIRLVAKSADNDGVVVKAIETGAFVNNNLLVIDARANGAYALSMEDQSSLAVRDNRVRLLAQANDKAVYEDAERTIYELFHAENNTTDDGFTYGSNATYTRIVSQQTSVSETGTIPTGRKLENLGNEQWYARDLVSTSAQNIQAAADLRLKFNGDDDSYQLEIVNQATGNIIARFTPSSFITDEITDFNFFGICKLLRATSIGLEDQAADPSNPSSGRCTIWQSDGTASGDDGDIMIKITDSLGATKTATLIDFSAV